jgi:ribosome-associated protein
VAATQHAIDLALIAADAAAEKLGSDIVLIDVSDRLALTDVFVIVTGSNERQGRGDRRFGGGEATRGRSQAATARGTSGREVGPARLLEIVVHIQHAEERVFYDLERLWRDCPTIPFDRPGAPAAERGR